MAIPDRCPWRADPQQPRSAGTRHHRQPAAPSQPTVLVPLVSVTLAVTSHLVSPSQGSSRTPASSWLSSVPTHSSVVALGHQSLFSFWPRADTSQSFPSSRSHRRFGCFLPYLACTFRYSNTEGLRITGHRRDPLDAAITAGDIQALRRRRCSCGSVTQLSLLPGMWNRGVKLSVPMQVGVWRGSWDTCKLIPVLISLRVWKMLFGDTRSTH